MSILKDNGYYQKAVTAFRQMGHEPHIILVPTSRSSVKPVVTSSPVTGESFKVNKSAIS